MSYSNSNSQKPKGFGSVSRIWQDVKGKSREACSSFKNKDLWSSIKRKGNHHETFVNEDEESALWAEPDLNNQNHLTQNGPHQPSKPRSKFYLRRTESLPAIENEGLQATGQKQKQKHNKLKISFLK